MDGGQVENAITGQDAVISALGPTRPAVPGMRATAARNITQAMQLHDVRRLVSTTGAGVRDPQDQPRFMDNLINGLLTLVSKDVLEDSEANVKVIRATNLDWTIVRFPMLKDGPRTGVYRVGFVGKNSGSQISRADGADFVIKELTQLDFVCQAPIVSY